MVRQPASLPLLVAAALAFGACSSGVSPVTATKVLEIPGLGGVVNAVGISPDGGRVAIGDVDGSLTVRDVPAGAVRWQGRGHTRGAASRIDAVVFSPDGSRVATAGPGNRAVALWDAADGRAAGTVAVRDARAIAFHPTDGALAVAAQATVHIVDTESTGIIRALPNAHQGDPVHAVAFSSDGHVLATASRRGSLKLWSWPAMTLRASVAVPPSPEELAPVSLAVTRHGTRVAANGILGRVHVVDAARGREERTFANATEAPGQQPHAEMRHSLAFTDDGNWLFAPDTHDRGLRIVHVPSGSTHSVIRGAVPFYKAVAIGVPTSLVALLHAGDAQGRGPYGLEVWRLAYRAK
jgi:hypothetical protein